MEHLFTPPESTGDLSLTLLPYLAALLLVALVLQEVCAFWNRRRARKRAWTYDAAEARNALCERAERLRAVAATSGMEWNWDDVWAIVRSTDEHVSFEQTTSGI